VRATLVALVLTLTISLAGAQQVNLKDTIVFEMLETGVIVHYPDGTVDGFDIPTGYSLNYRLGKFILSIQRHKAGTDNPIATLYFQGKKAPLKAGDKVHVPVYLALGSSEEAERLSKLMASGDYEVFLALKPQASITNAPLEPMYNWVVASEPVGGEIVIVPKQPASTQPIPQSHPNVQTIYQPSSAGALSVVGGAQNSSLLNPTTFSFPFNVKPFTAAFKTVLNPYGRTPKEIFSRVVAYPSRVEEGLEWLLKVSKLAEKNPQAVGVPDVPPPPHPIQPERLYTWIVKGFSTPNNPAYFPSDYWWLTNMSPSAFTDALRGNFKVQVIYDVLSSQPFVKWWYGGPFYRIEIPMFGMVGLVNALEVADWGTLEYWYYQMRFADFFNDIIAMRLWERMWALRHLYGITEPDLFWRLVAMDAILERFLVPLIAPWWVDVAWIPPSVRTLGGRIPDVLRRPPTTTVVVKKQ